MRFNQQVLVKAAGGDRTWQLILITAFQAPDNPWCFLETLTPFIKGVKAQRRGGGKAEAEATRHFDEVGRILQERYVRGIPAEDLASGKRRGTVQGYGDVGLYSGEHQTAILAGKTHPEGLRWKLEHWPRWIEHALLPLIDSWPHASDTKGIEALLRERRFAKVFPEGIRTTLVPRPGAKAVRILDLFGGDEGYTRGALSQALLYQEMLKPTDRGQRDLRCRFGWGVGPFTVRGLWMECNKFPALIRSFPQFDTAMFCPGFVGALGGVQACDLERVTGVSLSTSAKGSVNWSKWDVQIRFAAWMHALQSAKPERNLHCTEAEATLCFFLRYFRMSRSDGNSAQFKAAARAIGGNLDGKIVSKLFRREHVEAARRLTAAA